MQYANVPDGGTLAVLGLGPVGQFASRIGVTWATACSRVDPVPERRLMAERHGIETYDLSTSSSTGCAIATDGRGPDAVVDAVGMEAHGNPGVEFAHNVVGHAARRRRAGR